VIDRLQALIDENAPDPHYEVWTACSGVDAGLFHGCTVTRQNSSDGMFHALSWCQGHRGCSSSRSMRSSLGSLHKRPRATTPHSRTPSPLVLWGQLLHMQHTHHAHRNASAHFASSKYSSSAFDAPMLCVRGA
jgi:hypothetical protein